jgi:hypothetical protein
LPFAIFELLAAEAAVEPVAIPPVAPAKAVRLAFFMNVLLFMPADLAISSILFIVHRFDSI